MKDREEKDPKHEELSKSPAEGGVRNAEKVRSSRYEWENRAGENETPPPRARAARESLKESLRAWVARFFLSRRTAFDKDDDATPSAA